MVMRLGSGCYNRMVGCIFVDCDEETSNKRGQGRFCFELALHLI